MSEGHFVEINFINMGTAKLISSILLYTHYSILLYTDQSNPTWDIYCYIQTNQIKQVIIIKK